MEDIKVGLWEKKSAKGTIYYGGKTTIAGKDCFVTMFDNRENKKSDKSPDFQITIKEKVTENKVVTMDDSEGLPF